MRLLIVTQKIDKDDSYFGFFHDWITAFADTFEQVTVITLEARNFTLPENVTVHSLCKEHHSSRFTRLCLFWKYAWQDRASYDAVFCHMSPLYVIAGYPVWKILGKKIALWYSHRHVDLKLRVAVWLADIIFSTSTHAFRLKTSKVHFMGHAINTKHFARPADYPGPAEPRVVTVGRITPIKQLEVLISALGLLARRGRRVRSVFIGAPLMSSDNVYAEKLQTLASEQGIADSLTFFGDIPFEHIPEEYWKSTISVNLAPTGGMDKVVLEAAAAGIPVILANEAFRPLIEGYEDRLLFQVGVAEDLANKIEALLDASDRQSIAEILQARVAQKYSFSALMPSIIHQLEIL